MSCRGISLTSKIQVAGKRVEGMSTDDSILNFRGNEAEWAALCALDGMHASGEPFHQNQAPELIEQIWDFVVQTCEIEGVQVPRKELAVKKLEAQIEKFFS